MSECDEANRAKPQTGSLPEDIAQVFSISRERAPGVREEDAAYDVGENAVEA